MLDDNEVSCSVKAKPVYVYAHLATNATLGCMYAYSFVPIRVTFLSLADV